MSVCVGGDGVIVNSYVERSVCCCVVLLLLWVLLF